MHTIIRNMTEADRVEVGKMMEVFYASPAVLSNGSAEIFENEIAISKCETELLNTSLVVAQAADDLLNIKGIKASFVLSPNDSRIVISGRSLGDINVQVILEKMGGGGHLIAAAAVLSNVSAEFAERELVKNIMDYLEK